jgi:hypothetical protein
MSDNKNMRGPQDSQRINMNEDYEVTYWTKTLGVSKSELEKIVKRVGVMADDVRKEIRKS